MNRIKDVYSGAHMDDPTITLMIEEEKKVGNERTHEWHEFEITLEAAVKIRNVLALSCRRARILKRARNAAYREMWQVKK
jgi:hypothetical protein